MAKKSEVKNGLIINDKVSMEWSASGFYEISQGQFTKLVFASKVYESSLGYKIPVFFVPGLVFLWADNGGATGGDFWSIREVKSWVKEEGVPDLFPEGFDNIIKLNPNGDVDDAILDQFGLTEFKADIIARLDDIAPYGEEVVVEM